MLHYVLKSESCILTDYSKVNLSFFLINMKFSKVTYPKAVLMFLNLVYKFYHIYESCNFRNDGSLKFGLIYNTINLTSKYSDS